MFGYIRPVRAELLVKEADFYDAVYCGLCRYGGKHVSRFTRFLLNYDFTALALLRISLGKQTVSVERTLCPYKMKKKPTVVSEEAYDYVCSAFGLFAYYKWRDDVADARSPFVRLCKRCFSPLFSHIRKRALRSGFPEELIREPIGELHALEDAGCDSPDRAADCFGRLMKQVASHGLEGKEKAIAEQCGYHVGRFVYLIDAYDDLKEDEKQGSYNPFLKRYGTAEEAIRHGGEIRLTLEDSMRVFSRSFALSCGAVPTGTERILFNICDLGGREAVRRVEERLLTQEKGTSKNV